MRVSQKKFEFLFEKKILSGITVFSEAEKRIEDFPVIILKLYS